MQYVHSRKRKKNKNQKKTYIMNENQNDDNYMLKELSTYILFASNFSVTFYHVDSFRSILFIFFFFFFTSFKIPLHLIIHKALAHALTLLCFRSNKKTRQHPIVPKSIIYIPVRTKLQDVIIFVKKE